MHFSLLVIFLVGCLVEKGVAHSKFYGPFTAKTAPYVLDNCKQEVHKYNISRFLTEEWELSNRVWQHEHGKGARKVNADVMNFFHGLEVNALQTKSRKGRNKRDAHRVRKEYRSLTDEERTAYHNAVDAMKRTEVTVGMSEFDSFTTVHNGIVAPFAHGTPAFLPWHRHYLWLYEEALRAKDPTVTIPYWDSSIDASLVNPSTSIMWTDEYMGNAVGGTVRTGPFKPGTPAGWSINRTSNFNPTLLYNEGLINHLMDFKDFPSLFPHMEEYHNGAHVYIGGDMGVIPISPRDPIFYMHHAFVDCLWEEWRDNVQTLDPQVDYPSEPPTNGAFLHAPLIPWEETIHHALGPYYSQQYSCAPRKSKHSCDGTATPNGNHDKDSAEPFFPPALNPNTNYTHVYFRLRVDYQGKNPYLDPEYKPYNPYNPFSRSHAQEEPACCGGTSYVYAECQGEAYEGFSRDFVSFDSRLPVSHGYTYLSMPHPDSGLGHCQLRVYTPYGRPCTPLCRQPNSDPPRYEPCCGVLDLATDDVTYYNTYAEAIRASEGYNYERNSSYPIYYHAPSQYDSMIFYCESDDPMNRH